MPKTTTGLDRNFDYREYGLMKATRRKYNDVFFPVWSAIQDCEQENCIAAHACPYMGPNGVLVPGQRDPEGKTRTKCQVLMKYLKQVEHIVLKQNEFDLDDFDLFRVGMHIIPLYKQLCRFKIVEMSIMNPSIAEMTKSGTTKVNSIFKEIRECLKAIDMAWRELGISQKRHRAVEPENITPRQGYYEEMERQALNEQNLQNEDSDNLDQKTNNNQKKSKLVRR